MIFAFSSLRYQYGFTLHEASGYDVDRIGLSIFIQFIIPHSSLFIEMAANLRAACILSRWAGLTRDSSA